MTDEAFDVEAEWEEESGFAGWVFVRSRGRGNATTSSLSHFKRGCHSAPLFGSLIDACNFSKIRVYPSIRGSNSRWDKGLRPLRRLVVLTAPEHGGNHLTVRKIKRELPTRSAYAVAMELKRSDGLPVGALAERLGMSYMGIKAQCLALEKSGHVVSRSVHCGTGRPHLIYRLSVRGQELFQRDDNRFALSLLQEAQTLFGQAAAEKLLYLHFQRQAAVYAAKIRSAGTWGEKLAALAEIRESGGTMPRIDGETLVESHCPLAAIFEAYPAAAGMEEAMISKVIGLPVKRRRDGDQLRFERLIVG